MDTCSPAPARRMRLAVLGHVDHGKSTVLGRLLADTGNLPDGRLEEVRLRCERAGKRFEHAFLLDALADEQAQGITIDAARVFFRSGRRHYVVLDAPGHVEFLRNMVTGAAHAEVALLVIDAAEGVQENSRRHGYLASLLGVPRLLVVVNKMDLVGWSRERYESLAAEYGSFLAGAGIPPAAFLPASGLLGDNLASPSAAMPWYSGPTLLQALDSLEPPPESHDRPFRMFVQDVYKFTRYGDSRRIVVGTVESGSLGPGDELVFYPSGKRSRVHRLESFASPAPERAGPGQAVGFTLTEQVYVPRGELASRAGEPRPRVAARFRASVFWLGAQPFEQSRSYTLKLGTAAAPVRLQEVRRRMDAATLQEAPGAKDIPAGSVADVVLRVRRPLALDEVGGCPATSRFVVVDGHRIAGGGILHEALDEPLASTWEQKFARNQKWIPSRIAPTERAARYSQRAVLVLITGAARTDRKGLAQALEARLFSEGRFVYFLGIGSLLRGLDSDLQGRDPGQEHVRRLAEVVNILLHAGLIVLVSAADLGSSDLDLVQVLVGAENMRTVVLGEPPEAGQDFDLHLPEDAPTEASVERVVDLLADGNVFFRPW